MGETRSDGDFFGAESGDEATRATRHAAPLAYGTDDEALAAFRELSETEVSPGAGVEPRRPTGRGRRPRHHPREPQRTGDKDTETAAERFDL